MISYSFFLYVLNGFSVFIIPQILTKVNPFTPSRHKRGGFSYTQNQNQKGRNADGKKKKPPTSAAGGCKNQGFP
jgi:hypothetical protein